MITYRQHNIPIQFYVNEEEKAALDAYAREKRISLSRVLRDLIDQNLLGQTPPAVVWQPDINSDVLLAVISALKGRPGAIRDLQRIVEQLQGNEGE